MEVREVWTEADFETMGWHDATIYSISFIPSKTEYASGLSFDIDYIFKWVLNEQEQTFDLWISPCTLVFPDVFGYQMDFESSSNDYWQLEIDAIHMEDAQRPDFPGFKNFHIELQTGYITFQAYGFIQTVRQQPVLADAMYLGR